MEQNCSTCRWRNNRNELSDWCHVWMENKALDGHCDHWEDQDNRYDPVTGAAWGPVNQAPGREHNGI